MSAQKWTPEPWGQWTRELPKWVELRIEDYNRAAKCVDALAGIPNPEEFVAAAKELFKHAPKLDNQGICFKNFWISYEKLGGESKNLMGGLKEWVDIFLKAITRAEAAFGGKK